MVMERLERVVLYLIAAALPLAVLPGVLENAFELPKIVVLVGGSFTLSTLFALRKRSRDILLPQVWLLAILFCFLTLFYAVNPYYAKWAITINLSAFLIIFHVKHLRERKNRGLNLVITLTGVAVCIEAWLQFCGASFIMPALTRGWIISTVGNSNFLGAWLIFPVFSSLAIARERPLAWFLHLFILFGLALTRARAAWLGVIVGYAVFFWCKPFPLRLRLRNLAVAVLFCLGAWFALYSLSSSWSVGNLKADTLYLRVFKYWPPAFELFKESPLIGKGLEGYRGEVYRVQGELAEKWPGYFDDYPIPKPREAHNDFLDILVQGGLIGAAILLALVLPILRKANDFLWDHNRAALASIMGIFTSAFFFFPFQLPVTLGYTAIMLGLLWVPDGLIGVPSWSMIRLRGWKFVIFPVALSIMAWFTVAKPIVSQFYQASYLKTKDVSYLEKAVSWDRNTLYVFWLAFEKFKRNDIAGAYQLANEALYRFNGDVTLWELHKFLGVCSLALHDGDSAKLHFEDAIKLYPLEEEARSALRRLGE